MKIPFMVRLSSPRTAVILLELSAYPFVLSLVEGLREVFTQSAEVRDLVLNLHGSEGFLLFGLN